MREKVSMMSMIEEDGKVEEAQGNGTDCVAIILHFKPLGLVGSMPFVDSSQYYVAFLLLARLLEFANRHHDRWLLKCQAVM